jgi:Saxitoxin biosynthesis operon protein SxtJ
MKPTLKEDPREWKKFGLVATLFLGGASWLLWRRHTISAGQFEVIASFLGVAALVCLLRPRRVRPVYRVAMTVSFYMGQIMGRVMLSMLFVLVLTPLALALRLSGKDLLRLRRDRRANTYWRPAKLTEEFDRQF